MFNPVREFSLPLPPRVRAVTAAALDTEIRARVPEPMPVGQPSQHSTSTIISLALLTRQFLEAADGRPNEAVIGLRLENLNSRNLQSQSLMVTALNRPNLIPVLKQVTQQVERVSGPQPELHEFINAYQHAKVAQDHLHMALILRGFLLTINNLIDTRVTNSMGELVILDGRTRLTHVFNDVTPINNRITHRTSPEEHGIAHQLLVARNPADDHHAQPIPAHAAQIVGYPSPAAPLRVWRNNPAPVEHLPYMTRALFASILNSFEKKTTHSVNTVQASVDVKATTNKFRLPTDPMRIPTHRYAYYRHWSDLPFENV